MKPLGRRWEGVYLHEVVAGVKAQGGEGLYAGGQLAVLEGRQALAHAGGQRGQAAALRVVSPLLVAGQDQRHALQAVHGQDPPDVLEG